MKTKYCSFVIALLVLIGMSGCKKENTESIVAKSTNEKMLKFKSLEEFNNSVSSVLQMTTENRKKWASEKGFESFGVKCDEIYSNSHPETFTTIEEFDKLVADNSEFLCYKKMDNGELSLEPVLNKSPFRYFANPEKMYQIDDMIYRILETGTVSTASKNIEKLKLINDQNCISEYGKDPDLFFSNHINLQEMSTQTKSTTAMFGCLDWGHGDVVDGADWTSMQIWAYPQNYTNSQGQASSRNILHYQVIPRHKTLRWFIVKRTISLSINARVGYTIDVPPQPPLLYSYSYHDFTVTPPEQYTNNAEDFLLGHGSVGSWYNNDYGFKWYDCWGDTPSTPTVVLQCWQP